MAIYFLSLNGIVFQYVLSDYYRLSYALIGDSVNVASRIQEQTKKYQTDILISASTESLLGREFNLRKLDLTTLKGKTEPIGLFALA